MLKFIKKCIIFLDLKWLLPFKNQNMLPSRFINISHNIKIKRIIHVSNKKYFSIRKIRKKTLENSSVAY